jgi:hypothetical protein
MVLVRLEHVKAGQDKLIFFLDQLVQKLNIVGVVKVETGKRVHILEQLVLFLRQRGLRSFYVGGELLCQTSKSETELSVADDLSQVAIDCSEHLKVLLKNKGLKQACSLLVV